LLCPLLLSITRPPPVAAPVPYTTLFRSANGETRREAVHDLLFGRGQVARGLEEAFKVRYYTFGKDAARTDSLTAAGANGRETNRSEEHTSELQSRENLVCRLLLEKKKKL